MKKVLLGISLLYITTACSKNTYRCERLFKENLQLKNQLNEMQKVVRQITNNAEQTALQNRRLKEFIKYKTHE